MLPNMKNATVSAVLALAVALGASGPAAAWGQREQDTLKGAVGALILKAIIDDARRHNPPIYRTVPAPQPRYYYPPAPGYGHYTPRPAVSIYNTPIARSFYSYPVSQRYLIQRRLASWGYYRGGIDGSFGPGTYAAVVGYARANGMGRSLGTSAGAFGVYDSLIY